MSVQEKTSRIVAQGLDFKLPENRAALIDFVTSCLKFSLLCEPSARQDGSLTLQLAASEAARWLTVVEPLHTVCGQVVKFLPFHQSDGSARDDDVPNVGDSRKQHQKKCGPGVGKARVGALARGLARGRGQWLKPHSNSQLLGSGHGFTLPHGYHADRQQIPGHTSRQSDYDARGTFLSHMSKQDKETSAKIGPFSDPGQIPVAHHVRLPTVAETADTVGVQVCTSIGVSSVPVKDASFIRKGSTEGLDVITIRGLPSHASPKGLLVEVQSAINLAKSNVSFEASLVSWTDGEARIHINNKEAVFAWWRTRHRSALKYDGHVLSWDVTVPETYEENRILVEGLPDDITPYNLILHMKSTGCVPEDVEMTPLFLSDSSKAMIFFNDTIVDKFTVEDLRKTGSLYEGTGISDTYLNYGLVPEPHSVRVRGLDSTIDKGTLRNYFNRLHCDANLERPVLIDDVKMTDKGSAVVTLRTAEDCKALLRLPQMPGIGSKGNHPVIEVDSEYPLSVLTGSASTVGISMSTSSEATVKGIAEVYPEDPVVIDYIWNEPKHLKRLRGIVGCDDLDWDGCKLLVLQPVSSSEEYAKKICTFTDTYALKKLRISDTQLWERSLRFVQCEMTIRSCELTLLPYAEKLEMHFVGPENEVIPFHQHCANKISAWRTDLEDASRIDKKSLSIPSANHLVMLQRTSYYQKVHEEVTFATKQVGGKLSLNIFGPSALVQTTLKHLTESLQSITAVNVAVEEEIVRFLTTTGLKRLNALYQDSKVDAIATGLEQGFVKILTFEEARMTAEIITQEAYGSVPVDSTTEEQFQKVVRSEEYKVFSTSFCSERVVMLNPSWNDIRKVPGTVQLSVVGEKTVAENAAQIVETFLLDNVVLTEQLPLKHAGIGKFLKTFKVEELNQLKVRLASFKADIEIRSREKIIILRATRSRVMQLRNEVNRLVRGIHSEVKEFRKHGLLRSLQSHAFACERSFIEQTKQALIWITWDEENIESEIDRIQDWGSSKLDISATGGTERLFPGQFILSNKTNLSLELSEITTDNSDVIVAPVGTVYSAVAKISQQTANDFSARYGSSSNLVADLIAGGQLHCRRVYAVSVSTRSAGNSEEQCIREIEAPLYHCLGFANSSGYLSIAIPVICENEYGYTCMHFANAVVRASMMFATKYPSPSLTHIKVCVPNGHQREDFPRDFDVALRTWSESVDRNLETGYTFCDKAVDDSFLAETRESLLMEPTRDRPLATSAHVSKADVALITIYAKSRTACETVQAIVQKAIDRHCVITENNFDFVPQTFDWTELKSLARNLGVDLNIDLEHKEKRCTKVTLSGFKDNVASVNSKLLQYLNKASKEEAETAIRDRVMEKIRWCSKDEHGLLTEFSGETPVLPDKAKDVGETSDLIPLDCLEYENDIRNLDSDRKGSKSVRVGKETTFRERGSASCYALFDSDGKQELCSRHEMKASNQIQEQEKAVSVSSGFRKSEQFQLNKLTMDLTEIHAKQKLRRIEKECKVKIRRDPLSSSMYTAELISVEGIGEDCDLVRGLERLKQECLIVSRQDMQVANIKLEGKSKVSSVRAIKFEEMRIIGSVETEKCTIFGLKEDVEGAEKKIRRLLEQPGLPLSASNNGTFTLQSGQTVVVKKGNIIQEDVDVIVNAANERLEHSQGVAAVICKAAGGTSFQNESQKLVHSKGSIREGEAVCTGAGLLPFKMIVHAVGPRWSPYTSEYSHQITLQRACYNSLFITSQKGAKSVAIPGFGSGIYHVSKHVCAQALLNGAENFFKKNTTSAIKRVVFVDLDDSAVAAVMTEARKRYGQSPFQAVRDTDKQNQKGNGQGSVTRAPAAGSSRSWFPWFRSGDSTKHDTSKEDSAELCPICADRTVNFKLQCGHEFCKTCIDQWAKTKPTCPNCNRPLGKVTGNQPVGGRMDTKVMRKSLPGYEQYDTIVIIYNIPSGVQGDEHPNPGARFYGASRTAYLPNNREGNELLGLLRKAFDARLVFTVGRSVTTGLDNVVAWNDIHHKTNTHGGTQRYGYPDATYLTRLRADLKVKGIE